MTTQTDKAPPKKVEKPEAGWTDDKLELYVRSTLKQATELEDRSLDLGHKSAIALFRCGNALFIMRERRKSEGSWMAWLKACKFAVGTAHEAIRLYEKAKNEKALQGLTITAAKEKYGIVKPKEKRGVANSEPSQQKRFVIAFPKPGKEFKVLGDTLRVFEQVLQATKEAVANTNGDSQAELDALKGEFDRIFEEGTRLFGGRPQDQAGSKSLETSTNGRGV